jgi:hypothetical protein
MADVQIAAGLWREAGDHFARDGIWQPNVKGASACVVYQAATDKAATE